jgi:hypothetical protein
MLKSRLRKSRPQLALTPWKLRASDRQRVMLRGRPRLVCTLSPPVQACNTHERPLYIALPKVRATLVPMAIGARKSLREPSEREPAEASITPGPV